MNIFIGFYTVQTPYEDIIKTYELSLKKFNLQYKLYPILSKKNWYKNCQEKTKIILQALEEFPSNNIIYSDADSEILSNPILFENLSCDIAYHYNTDRHEILSGTLFFSNNNKVKKLLERWAILNSINYEWDQRNLQYIIENRTSDLNLTTFLLPTEYCCIFDYKFQLQNLNGKLPVIMHYQKSRKLKNRV